MLRSACGWNQSSWVDSWKGRPNTSKNEPAWRGEPNAPNDESWVDQSWLQRPRNASYQSDSYFEEDDDVDAYEDLPDSYIDDNEDDSYATQSWSPPLPSSDAVPRPEPLWQPHYREQYEHGVETVDELRHLGMFGIKPPYGLGTHEDNPLATEYTKVDPKVLVMASSAMAGQRRGHQFLIPRQATVVSRTNAAIQGMRGVVDIDSWRKTAPFPYDTMRSAPDMSFDKNRTPGSAPSYEWYKKIEVACQNFRNALVEWRKRNEELNWGFRNNVVETDLPNQNARLNRMHREICGIDDQVQVADGIDLLCRYRSFWTLEKMPRSAPSAVSILGLIRDLQKVCQMRDWLFEDRAPFLVYKVDLLLGRHQL